MITIAIPILLLIARWIKIQRETLDIHALWEPYADPTATGGHRPILVLALGIFATMVIAALLLSWLGKKEWIATGMAAIFALHFYLLPAYLSRWEDILIASAAIVAAIITPFWFPDQFWLWWLVASSVCALACWLAADLRFQEALALQEEERREIDHAADTA